jgi:hypothetical protein
MKEAEATFAPWKADAFAIALIPIEFIILILPHYFFWGGSSLLEVVSNRFSVLLLLLALIGGLLVRELIHKIGYFKIGRVSWNLIKLGIDWRHLIPTSHTDALMTANEYRLSLLMPTILLGVVPAFIGIAFGIGFLTILGFLMVVVAGGDVVVIFALRSVPDKAMVRDHPDKIGCYVLA